MATTTCTNRRGDPMHALQQRVWSVPSVGQLPIGKVSMGLASKVGCRGVRDGGRLAAGIRLRSATNANDQGSGAEGDGLRLNKLYSQLGQWFETNNGCNCRFRAALSDCKAIRAMLFAAHDVAG